MVSEVRVLNILWQDEWRRLFLFFLASREFSAKSKSACREGERKEVFFFPPPPPLLSFRKRIEIFFLFPFSPLFLFPIARMRKGRIIAGSGVFGSRSGSRVQHTSSFFSPFSSGQTSPPRKGDLEKLATTCARLTVFPLYFPPLLPWATLPHDHEGKVFLAYYISTQTPSFFFSPFFSRGIDAR